MEEKTYEDVEQEFWNPENPEDFISGIYLNVQREVGENKANVYNLETSNGNILSVWGSTVLDQKFQLVKIGADIKIVYLGMKKGDKRNYKDFKIQRAKQQ